MEYRTTYPSPLGELTLASDGTALTGSLSDVTQTGGTLYTEDGYTCVITMTASVTNVGKVNNSYTVEIYKDGVLVTDHYMISKTSGDLSVKARAITIAAKSAERQFIPGQALVCNEIDYDPAALAVGDTIASYEVKGSQKSIGESANIIQTIVIKNSKGEVVTSNYSITILDGVLKVTVPKK